MTTCPSGVNYMHIIDDGRNYIEKTYKRTLSDRFIRGFLSKVLTNSFYFRIVAKLVFLPKLFFSVPQMHDCYKNRRLKFLLSI